MHSRKKRKNELSIFGVCLWARRFVCDTWCNTHSDPNGRLYYFHGAGEEIETQRLRNLHEFTQLENKWWAVSFGTRQTPVPVFFLPQKSTQFNIEQRVN